MDKKIALVTGGLGGMGTAICHALSKAGYQVVANHHKAPDDKTAQDWQTAQRALGFEIALASGDVSDYASCEQMIATIEKTLGPLDVLVNNAGITRDITFRKMTVDQWQAVINTNLNSAFNVTHQVINGMCDRGFGRIINISSVNGQKGQFGQTNYSAAKAGVHGFTMALAQEVAKKGITVNTVAPGYIDTAMLAHIPENVMQGIIANIPVGRLGKPEDIARVVAFLASPENEFITGALIPVNGGQYMC
jgi:acetoacetyl-CoA reductase